jgi:hypothetical protein
VEGLGWSAGRLGSLVWGGAGKNFMVWSLCYAVAWWWCLLGLSEPAQACCAAKVVLVT